MNAPARAAVVRRRGDFSRFTRTPVTLEIKGYEARKRQPSPQRGDGLRRRLPTSSAGDRGRLQQRMTIAISVNLGNISGRVKYVVAHPRSSLYRAQADRCDGCVSFSAILELWLARKRTQGA